MVPAIGRTRIKAWRMEKKSWKTLESEYLIRRPWLTARCDRIQLPDYPTPPNRLPYPSDELNFNRDNCQAAISTNYKETTGYYTNLFWAKEVYYSLY